MKNVGFIGWRGMVGSVLMQRMVEERDFDAIRPVFFSTSQLGQAAPSFGGTTGTLQDAYDLEALKALDIIVTCQGGDYTNEIYPKLRESGWQGYWIDAASSLRPSRPMIRPFISSDSMWNTVTEFSMAVSVATRWMLCITMRLASLLAVSLASSMMSLM